ncbi:ParA family protein [Hymenobacter sp.]|jgi:cellulose biosynthesis protein BcsQ|uniref:ParA family protein n=1 Tax=Hymenobacter sp. TaxID=1898978 RepID=UPI002ED8A1CE
MSKTKYISISSQKGGVGKSTITTLIASHFHFTTPLKVVVVDCDYPQWTVENFRQDELELFKKTPEKMAEFKAFGKKAYAILKCQVKDAREQLEDLEGAVDLVLVDTPGTLNIAGIPELWRKLDYIFIPIEPDAATINSTLAYTDVLRHYTNQPDSSLKGFYCFWNKFVKSEKQTFFNQTEKIFQEEGVTLLASRLEQSVAYRKSEVRSTMTPMRKEFYHLGIKSLIEEIQAIVFPVKEAASVTEPA